MSSFLEIGCGTGYVLSGIANVFRDAKLHASEIFLEGLSFAAARQPSINFMQMDARTIPFVEEFDCIGAFDVLEHIEEDQRVLTQAFEALRPGGILLLTVPQHAWLWSAVDDYACHVRRYSSKAIRESVEMAGFEILRSTSFVFTLLPAMWLSRQFQRISGRAVEVKAELEIPASLNHIFAAIMRVEEKMIRTGMSLPIGGSRMVVARKR
jgi:SAM-dependent methyltransferase